MTTFEVEVRSAFFVCRVFKHFQQSEEKMYIQMKKTGLDVVDLIPLTRRKKDNISTFPY